MSPPVSPSASLSASLLNPTPSQLQLNSPPSLIVTASTPHMRSPSLPGQQLQNVHQSPQLSHERQHGIPNQASGSSIDHPIDSNSGPLQPQALPHALLSGPSNKILAPSLRARAASQSVSLSRPPSLVQLTEAMRLNPDRWQQLKIETDAARVAPNIPAPPAHSSQDPASQNASPSTPLSTGRLRLQVSTLQRSNQPGTNQTGSSFVNYSITGPQAPPQPALDSTQVDQLSSLTLQRRASASDITIGLNRARLPSLAAIQERMSRTKPDSNHNTVPPPSSKSGTTTTSGLTTIASATESESQSPALASQAGLTPTSSRPTHILSSISPAQRADLIQANALDQPSAPSLGTPNPHPTMAAPTLALSVEKPTVGQLTGVTPTESNTPSPAASQPTPPSIQVPPGLDSTTVLPLQHSWTLFFDSKATLASARRSGSSAAVSPANPIGGGSSPNPASADEQPSAPATPPTAGSHLGAGGQAYQAALQTIGTFQTVEHFCRYFNWTIRPSQMELHSSVQLFKDGIKPMWEDPANSKGGKWTVTMKQANIHLLDRLWTYLVLGLVGEEVDLHDDVCGAIIATRPRGNRLQVWVREKDNVERVNGLGKRLIQLLEITEETGVSVEFSPHSGPNHGSSKFISIAGNASPQRPALGPHMATYSPGHPPGIRPSGMLAAGPLAFQRLGTPTSAGSSDMRRTSSLDQQRLPRPPLAMHHSHLGSPRGGFPVLNQLNSHDPPIQNGIWRPSGPPPARTPPPGIGLGMNQQIGVTGVLGHQISSGKNINSHLRSLSSQSTQMPATTAP